jgi:hypothetical protein
MKMEKHIAAKFILTIKISGYIVISLINITDTWTRIK